MYLNAFYRGNTVYVRTVDGDFKCNPTAELFQSDPKGQYKDLRGNPLIKREFDSFKTARKFIENYQDVFPIYGQNNFLEQYIYENYKDTEAPKMSQIRTHTLDIEVDVPTGAGFPHAIKAEHPINAISIIDSISNNIYVFGLGSWDKRKAVQDGEITDELAERVKYKNCADERELLQSLLVFWKTVPPHVISGWNSDTFDNPYIYYRIKKILGEKNAKKISPWGMVKPLVKRGQYGDEVHEIKIEGVSQLDYLKLYKTFTYKIRDSYKLDAIANVELGKEKLSYDEVKSLYQLSKTNFNKFISYNIVDSVLVEELDQKLNLIPLAVDIAWKAKINFEDVYSPVKTWDALCCNALAEKGIAPPLSKYGKSGDKFEGGYNKEPIPGMYYDVISFDLESLYPSIVIQWNIGGDTIDLKAVRGDIRQEMIHDKVEVRDGYSVAANGVHFATDKQSFLSELMEGLKVDRKAAKAIKFEWETKKQNGEPDCDDHVALYHTRQLALKILLNSGYGVLASEYFRFYDIRSAEAITLTGQSVIQYIEKEINDFLNKKIGGEYEDFCIAIDTDSNYFTIKKLMDKFRTGDLQKDADIADKICKGLEEKVIKPSFDYFFERMNCYKPQMFMDREAIATNGFWTSKKHYALNVIDNEGIRYKEPKLKVVGLSLIQSRTPEWVRDRLKNALQIILESDEEDRVVKYINQAKKDFLKLSPNDIAFNVKVGDIAKCSQVNEPYYKKGTQAQLRAVLLHNKLTEKHPTVLEINQGETVKWSWLKKPNPLYDDVVAFDTYLPEEFGLDDYICYNTQFFKTFHSPLKDICDVIDVKHENVVSLSKWGF